MAPAFYKLDNDRKPVRVHDADWVDALGTYSGVVVKREIAKNTVVSTIFWGITAPNDRDLLLFETSVFGPDGTDDGLYRKYRTWDEAVEGHEEIMRTVLGIGFV